MLRRPRRLGRMLAGVLLLAMGLGALVKPPAPTPGFVNPSKIAACLTPLGYSVGTLQKVPGELWQAVSAKPLFHGDYGDVNLFVSGPSERIARAVELEANACADRWPVARAELLRALPFLLEHLRLPISAELFQVIEADTGERAGTAEFMVGSAKVICATGAPVGDLRSARVSLARKQPRMERTMRKTMALLGSCHLLLPGLRGPEPVKEPEIVRVRLKPQDQAASAGPQPIPDVARVFAVIYLQEALKDVDSAKIQWGSDWDRRLSLCLKRIEAVRVEAPCQLPSAEFENEAVGINSNAFKHEGANCIGLDANKARQDATLPVAASNSHACNRRAPLGDNSHISSRGAQCEPQLAGCCACNLQHFLSVALYLHCHNTVPA